MGKNNPSNPSQPGKRGQGAEPSGASGGTMAIVTLVAVGLAVVIAWLNFQETKHQRSALEERISLLEGQITALGSKVDAAARAAAQARPQPPPQPQGPDPNKVYAVKTDGAPAIGPKSAPITIAEFSDFQ